MNWTVSVILPISQMLPLMIDPSGSRRIPEGNTNSIMLSHQYQARISAPTATYWTHSICVSCFKSKQAFKYLSLMGIQGIIIYSIFIYKVHVLALCAKQQSATHRALLHRQLSLQQIFAAEHLCKTPWIK